MPKGVYKKSKEHIAKVIGNLKPGWNKGLKGVGAVGVKNGAWSGNKVGYFGIHSWLINTFGKATKCEHCGSTNKIEWAKLKDKKYQRKRENFIELCHKCHANYDRYFTKALNIAHKLNEGNTYRRINLIGQRFGKLIVISLAGKNKWGNLKFLCKCDCGGQKIIPSANLRDGRTNSCGCMSSRNFMKGNQINKGCVPWNKGLKIKL